MTTMVPLVPAAVGLGAFTLAAIVAVRTRSLFRPKLKFQFKLDHQFSKPVPRKARKDPVALVLVSDNPNTPLTETRFPFVVKNNSRRRIGEVSVELAYPTAYFISNQAHEELARDALRTFPKHKETIDLILEQLSHRTARKMGDMVYVTYQIGSLRPGEQRAFHETIRVPVRDEAFSDPRFESKLFGKILRLIGDAPAIRGVCHVRGWVLSDLNLPIKGHIDVVVGHSDLEHIQENILQPYQRAHWLNDPSPKAFYFKPLLPIPQYWQRFKIDRPVDIVFVKMVYDTAKIYKDHILVGWDDLLNSVHAVSWIRLPGYPYYEFPRGVRSVDDALMMIGFGRIGPKRGSMKAS